MLTALKNLKVTWKLFLVGVAFLACALLTGAMAARTFANVQVGGSPYQLIVLGAVIVVVVMALLRFVSKLLVQPKRESAPALERAAPGDPTTRAAPDGQENLAAGDAVPAPRSRRDGRFPSLPPAPAVARFARRTSSRSLRPEPPNSRIGRPVPDSTTPPDGDVN